MSTLKELLKNLDFKELGNDNPAFYAFTVDEDGTLTTWGIVGKLQHEVRAYFEVHVAIDEEGDWWQDEASPRIIYQNMHDFMFQHNMPTDWEEALILTREEINQLARTK